MKKVILVTGASSGIGKATAKKLIQDGHIVYVAARRVEMMKDLQEAGAITLAMDVTVEKDVQSAIATIKSKHGGVDVLINNAGYGLYGTVEDISIEDARRQFEVNMFGMARLTQLVLPYMREKKSGTIINMSSMGGKMYTPLGAWYHATKHAVEGWSDCLRLELKPFGINVVIIEPGIITTEFGDVLLDKMKNQFPDSPYKKLIDKVAKSTAKNYRAGAGSPASLIADTISQAISSSRPKTRYAAGKFSKLLINARKYLGDKVFDKLIMSQV